MISIGYRVYLKTNHYISIQINAALFCLVEDRKEHLIFTDKCSDFWKDHSFKDIVRISNFVFVFPALQVHQIDALYVIVELHLRVK